MMPAISPTPPIHLRDLLRIPTPARPTPEQEAEAALLDGLLAAATVACEHHGDCAQARKQMRQDCIRTPPHLRADLLDHFLKTYPPVEPQDHHEH